MLHDEIKQSKAFFIHTDLNSSTGAPKQILLRFDTSLIQNNYNQ
jgi:hypothetical protein